MVAPLMRGFSYYLAMDTFTRVLADNERSFHCT